MASKIINKSKHRNILVDFLMFPMKSVSSLPIKSRQQPTLHQLKPNALFNDCRCHYINEFPSRRFTNLPLNCYRRCVVHKPLQFPPIRYD